MHADSMWTPAEQAILTGLDTPWKVQEFLDSIPYDVEHVTRSPRYVLHDRVAHCSEGALFAAAALRFHGHAPLLLDLRAWNDDDHVLAIYRVRGHIGAVAKSNFSGLRFREPIYRTCRELALSYFEVFFNTLAQKSLRAYSRLLDLRAFDAHDWMTTAEDVGWIADRLDDVRHYPLVDGEMIRGLQLVDKRLYDAGMWGADAKGVYQARSD